MEPGLNLGETALEGEEDEVGAAADAEFAEKIGDVKFYGTLGDVELVGDFLVGKIFEERIENFLLAAAEIGDGIGFQAAALAGEDGIDETGQELAGNPEASAGDERKGTDELIAGFDVGEQTLHAETQKRITVGVGVLFTDDDEARFGMALHEIGEKSAGGRTRGVAVDDIDLCDGRLEIAHVGRERGFELFDGDLELGLRQNAFEFAQHERVRRQDADSQFG